MSVHFGGQVYESLKAQADHQKELGGVESFHGSAVDFSHGGTKAVIEFTAAQSAVLERDKRVRVGLRRYGKMNSQVIVRYVTPTGLYVYRQSSVVDCAIDSAF